MFVVSLNDDDVPRFEETRTHIKRHTYARARARPVRDSDASAVRAMRRVRRKGRREERRDLALVLRDDRVPRPRGNEANRARRSSGDETSGEDGAGVKGSRSRRVEVRLG